VIGRRRDASTGVRSLTARRADADARTRERRARTRDERIDRSTDRLGRGNEFAAARFIGTNRIGSTRTGELALTFGRSVESSIARRTTMTDDAMASREIRTPTRPRKSAKYAADGDARRGAMKTTLITDEDRNLPITPGEEDRHRGHRDGESRRVSVASTVAATPESAIGGWRSRFGVNDDAFGATPWTPVGTRRGVPANGGGFDSPERGGGVEREEATIVAAHEDACVYGTPPSSPRAADVAKLVCPRTPMKARRTRERVGLDENGDVRPRGRVMRSLLEEFDAAERSLEDMVENKSDSTTLWKNRFDENFDPFDEPA